MFIKTLSGREKYLALATILIAFGAMIYNIVIGPISKRWAELNSEIASKVSILKKDLKLLSAYKAQESDYKEFSRYLKTAGKEEEELARVLNEIETASRDSACILVSVKPQGTKDLASYKELLIDVTQEGDMSRFSKFLFNIENSKSIMLKIKRFTMSSKSSEANTLRGTFLISKILID